MTQQIKKGRKHPRPDTPMEDERGWAGQRGQHPANEEEKNYRPHEGNRPKDVPKV